MSKYSGGVPVPYPHPNDRMPSSRHFRDRLTRRMPGVTLFVLVAIVSSRINAQENGPGPLEPPPEHKVTRVVGGITLPEAPPSLPPAEIIKTFTQREDSFASARPQYAYRRTIRIQEFGMDGKPSGEYLATSDAIRS